MKTIPKIFCTLALTVSSAAVFAQDLAPRLSPELLAREANTLKSYVGTVELLLPRHVDHWITPNSDEEAQYLDAIARGALATSDGEMALLGFIERHPHSAYLPYAQMRLGEWYFVRGNYRSAAYWFRQYDPQILPAAMEEASDYYLAYSMMRDGRDEAALSRFEALIFSPTYSRDAQFYAGYLALKRGDRQAAFKYLDPLQSDPMYGPYATAYLAEAFLAGTQYSKALSAARRGLSCGNLPETVHEALLRSGGLSASNLGDQKLSVQYLSEYVGMSSAPGRVELLTLGMNLFELNKNSQALTYLQQVPGGQRDFMAQLARYYEGLTRLSMGQQKEAQRAFEQAVEINSYPSLTEASSFNAALTSYSFQPGRLGAGTTALEDFLNTYPTSEYKDKAAGHLSDAYAGEPDVEKALAALGRIRQLPPSLVKTKEKVRLRRANTYLGSGRTSEASRQYDEIIQSNSDPSSVAQALLWKGEAAYREGKYEEAIASTRRYIESNPSPVDPNAYFNLGYSYYNTSNWTQAQKNLEKYLAVADPSATSPRTAATNRLADIAVLQRDYDDAIDLYRKALQIGGAESDYALFKEGMTLGLQKKYAEKASTLAQMPHRYPNSDYLPEALYEQGRALSLSGDEASAGAAFQKAFEGYPKSEIAPRAGIQLALTKFNSNQPEAAARIYEQVIRRYPKSEEARTALQDLKSISVQLNKVEEFTHLANEIGAGTVISATEADSLAYIAAERVIAEGSPKEAHAALDRYVSSYPTGAFIHRAGYNRAVLLYKEAKTDEAITTLEDLYPRVTNGALRTEIFRLLAKAYTEKGRLSDAATAYLTLAQSASSSTEANNAIASAVQSAERANDQSFLISLASNVEKGEYPLLSNATKSKVYGAVAEVFARSNQKAEALHYADRILSLPASPFHARAHVIKALALYDQGDYPAAKSRIEKLIEQGTTDTYWLARGFILLADIAVKQGDPGAARGYLESVLSSYDNKEDGIRQMIQKRLSQL